MSQIKLAIYVPSAGSTPHEFSQSFIDMINKLRVEGVTGQRLDVNTLRAISSNWIDNRERLVRAALDLKATHILWLDDDMQFHPDLVSKRFSRNKDIVITNYLVK